MLYWGLMSHCDEEIKNCQTNLQIKRRSCTEGLFSICNDSINIPFSSSLKLEVILMAVGKHYILLHTTMPDSFDLNSSPVLNPNKGWLYLSNKCMEIHMELRRYELKYFYMCVIHTVLDMPKFPSNVCWYTTIVQMHLLMQLPWGWMHTLDVHIVCYCKADQKHINRECSCSEWRYVLV